MALRWVVLLTHILAVPLILKVSLVYSFFSIESEFDSKVNLEKNIKIWNKIGKKVCDYYTKEGNEIIFSPYEEKISQVLTKINFIFLLDVSSKKYKN